MCINFDLFVFIQLKVWFSYKIKSFTFLLLCHTCKFKTTSNNIHNMFTVKVNNITYYKYYSKLRIVKSLCRLSIIGWLDYVF